MDETVNPKANESSWLDSLTKIATIVIAVISVAFTGIYGWMSMRNQEATRLLAITEVKVALVPYLYSENPMQRVLGLELAKNFDMEFIVNAALPLAMRDSEPEVRRKARAVLESLSRSNSLIVSDNAKKGIGRTDVQNELREKGLLSKLRDAQGYIDGGAPNGYSRAVEIYLQVLDQMSTEAKSSLDRDLLERAGKEAKKGHMDLAARKLASLFADYR